MKNVLVKTLDNRSLLLALDYLYRENMKIFEREKLLPASTELVEKLGIPLIDVPVEGYYPESEELTEYFLKIRSLQKCTKIQRQTVQQSESYRLLSNVMSSEIFGKGIEVGDFFTQRRDPLYYALRNISVREWSVAAITSEANTIAANSDDISLAGIAAFITDSVAVAAVRESVALYGSVAVGCAMIPPEITYEWQVDTEVQDKVNRFIGIFNVLTSGSIPEASPENIRYFYDACEENSIAGRCIYIGYDDTKDPVEKYHWAIKPSGNGLVVEEFWSSEIWTTERYGIEKLYA